MSAGFYPMSGRLCPLIFSILNIREAGGQRLLVGISKTKAHSLPAKRMG
jgi:hypothetical protein